MKRVESIWTAYRQAPTTVQWSIGAVVIAVLFLAWNDIVVRLTDEWDVRAHRMLANVDRAAGDTQRLQSLARLRPVVLGLGPVDAPGSESEAEKRLNMAVNEVLKEHPVSRDSFSLRSPAKLKRGTLERLISSDQRVERITGDLRFVAGPDEATAIIAALEKRPEIESISSVRITRKAGRKVTLDLTVDVWIVTSQRKSRGGGA